MYTQPEINSFDQHIWRSERQTLYKRISDFCRQHNLDFVNKIRPEYISSSPQSHIVYMLLFDRIGEDAEWQAINQQCQQNGRTVSVVTDNILTGAEFDCIKFYSYPELMGMTASYNDVVLPNPEFSRLYNCFIQRTDSVRQSWFYFLYSNHLLDKGYVSFLLTQISEYSDLAGVELFKYNHEEFGLNTVTEFDHAYHALLDQVPYKNFVEEENLLPLITDSKYSLILETCATDEIGPWSYTEKILRSLQYPTIPLIFGARESIGILKKLGFELAIDLDYIDQLPWQQRQQALLKILVEDSIDFDVDSLYNQAMHNRLLLQNWKVVYQKDNFFDKFFTEALEN